MTQCEMDNRFERQKQFMEVTEEWFKEHCAQALSDLITKLPDGKDINGTVAQFKVK